MLNFSRIEASPKIHSRNTVGDEVACEAVKLAVARHLADLENQNDKNYPFVFSERHAQKAISFFRMLRHTSGKLAGEFFNLQDNQAFKLAMLFGWRQKEDGSRRFTQGYIEEARKGGKSQFAAGIELFCGLFEERKAQRFTQPPQPAIRQIWFSGL